MRLKSYFADTIEAAMALAGRELGEEALLVYSREAAPEARYLGAYEVVFAGGPAAVAPGQPPPEVAPAAFAPAAPAAPAAALPSGSLVPAPAEHLRWVSSAFDDLRNEIGSLRNDVAAHRRAMEEVLVSADRRAWRLLSDWSGEPESVHGVALASQLLRADMNPEHVLELMESVRDQIRSAEDGGAGNAGTASQWKKLLREELVARRNIDAGLTGLAGRTVILLTGPPGSGKTTVAMQLAAYAASRGLNPRLIAFEPARLAAAQTLRSYAAVLGAPFDLTRQGERLAALVARQPAGSLVIIDGPGVGLREDDSAVQLAAFCELQAASETWLVLPGVQRSADLEAAAGRLARFRPARLVFTRTSEVRHWGAVWSCAEQCDSPLAFFCEGPRIPEDLTVASAERLAENLLAMPASPASKPGGRLGRPSPRAGRAELASAGGRR